jgi:hypothetical protein
MTVGLLERPMAKKSEPSPRVPGKKKEPAARSPGRPVSEEGPRVQVLGIRGRPDWKEWLREFADFHRSEMVDLIDDALEAFAKSKGFRLPPKR